MKTLITLLLLVMAFIFTPFSVEAGCGEPHDLKKSAKNVKKEATKISADKGADKIIKLKIEGMRCGNCIDKAKGILGKLASVKAAHIDLETGIATGFCSSSAKASNLKSTLEKMTKPSNDKKAMGWKVSVLSGEDKKS